MLQEYNQEVQKLFLQLLVTDPELFYRALNIYNPENFDKKLRPAASLIKSHSDKYGTLPSVAQIKATTGVELSVIDDYQEADGKWFLDEFESFTKREELERAILQSHDLLSKGEYGPVESLIKKAVQISLQKDLGLDYFADPKARLLALKTNNAQLSTGWPNLDELLNGGFNRGELQLFSAGSGGGKSLFMQNLAVNFCAAGFNGVYITLELSEGLCAARLDCMVAELSTKELYSRITDVEERVKTAGKSYGGLQFKSLPQQSTVNDIRAYCRELQIRTKKKIDFICLDYIDLMMPVNVKISAGDLFVKDKYVSEEVRNLAIELNVAMITASQLNRSAVNETEFDHSHISGGISKIQTADNMFGIFSSRAMRERGQYQVQLLKTRSSDGVGKKIDLKYNPQTLRITSPDSNTFGTGGSGKTVNQLMAKIKRGEIDGNTGEILEKPKDQSTMLHAMLATRKS